MYFKSMKMQSIQIAIFAALLGAGILISQSVRAATIDTLTYTWKNGTAYLRDHHDSLWAKGLTGSYASAMPIGAEWWGFSTDWPRDPVSPGVCPGTKCPGLIRFVGPSP